MKTATIEGKKYKIRTLPLEYAPKVFEVIKDMFEIADLIVGESAQPIPKDKNETLKVFLAIVDYTQEKVKEAKFFREHPGPLDIPGSGIGAHTSREAVKAPKAEEK